MKKCLIVWLTLIVSLWVLPVSMNASGSQGVEITTPDRSLEARFLKAYRSGEYVVVEMLFRNVTEKDYSIRIFLGDNVVVYDELGNQYTGNIYGTFMKEGNLRLSPRAELPADVPVRFNLYIKDVADDVRFLPRVNLNNFIAIRPARFVSSKLIMKNISISDM
ncbi:hypothetical protein [uncultured Bacteroides sp.]|uniref:hypothetical protein n=1 Tax=uncultured Bacteroides sp. TaxID=162156 RepID=UPI00280B79BC|nr:hypothetical protein [uncultured Bacteroides sp.]